MEEGLIWFSDVREYKEELGKKGYAIAKLYQKKYPFASGFILSKNAYKNLLNENSVSALKAVLLNIDNESEQRQAIAYEKIQSILQSTKFSDDFRMELKEALDIFDSGNFQIVHGDPDVNYRSLPVNNLEEVESAVKRCFAASFKNPVKSVIQSAIVLSLPKGDLQANLYSRYPKNECKLELRSNGKIAEYEMTKKPDLKLNCIKDDNNLIKMVSTQTLSRMVFYARDLERKFNCPQQVSFVLDSKDNLTLFDSQPYLLGRQEHHQKHAELSEPGLKKLNDIIPLENYVVEQSLLNHHVSKLQDSIYDSLHFFGFLTQEMLEVTDKILLEPYTANSENVSGLANYDSLPKEVKKEEVKIEDKVKEENKDFLDYEKAVLEALGE